MLAPANIGWFLPLIAPIAIWVAWSDMKFMKIPNKAVIILALVYAGGGALILPLPLWLWGFALMGIVLVIGFVASTLRLIGAGDAKFAAAMAPFFVGSDLRFDLALFAACVLAAVASHRLMRAIPPIRRISPDWASWTHKDFPMGLALAGTLVFYLCAAILLK